jgi:DNA-directed RNA polymerase subunit RPC12/RpoP
VRGEDQVSGGCPGSDGRNLSVELYKCCTCGAEVEMFSDEVKVKCPECGTQVFKDAVPNCVQWCAKARECIGEERWSALHPETGETGTTPADQEEHRHE